jgi:hypothetical protein
MKFIVGLYSHAHSLEEMNAGKFLPGHDCDVCRIRPKGPRLKVVEVNRQTKTVTVEQEKGPVASRPSPPAS